MSAAADPAEPRDIAVRDGAIRLGQLLKLAGVADSGGEAKELLQAGAVQVNGAPEGRRGRSLVSGDVVQVGDEVLRITTHAPGPG